MRKIKGKTIGKLMEEEKTIFSRQYVEIEDGKRILTEKYLQKKEIFPNSQIMLLEYTGENKEKKYKIYDDKYIVIPTKKWSITCFILSLISTASIFITLILVTS